MDQNQQHEGDERLAGGDLLVGADAIRAFLIYLGMPEDTDVYYLKRAGHWPIGNTGGEGGKLIASKRRLIEFADKITRGNETHLSAKLRPPPGKLKPRQRATAKSIDAPPRRQPPKRHARIQELPAE
jgi:hypothetical protein